MMSGSPTTLGRSQYVMDGSSRQRGKFGPLST